MRLPLIAALLLCVACGSSGKKKPARAKNSGANAGKKLTLSNSGLNLEIDSRLKAKLFVKDDKGKKTFVSLPKPLFQLWLKADKPVKLKVGSSKKSKINDSFGAGEQLSLVAQNATIKVTLNLIAYAEYPTTFFMDGSVEAKGKKPVAVAKIVQNQLSLANKEETWAFQGAALRWGTDFIFKIDEKHDSRNWHGATNDMTGGGIPVNDLWTRKRGLAIGHVDPKAQAIFLPIQNTTELSTWLETPAITLAPKTPQKLLRTFMHLHQGDFYETLSQYKSWLGKGGMQFAESPPEASEAIWCSWGYEFDVRPKEMLGVTKMLKKLGIHWAVLDDRWFDAYGDWQPRKDTFGKRAVKALKKLVKKSRRKKVKLKLWWIPLVVERQGEKYDSHEFVNAKVITEHPEWLVLDKDGKPAKTLRNLNMLCPALPEVQDYMKTLTERFIGDWGFDGHKLDVVFAIPPCHNPAHKHPYPEASSEAMADAYKVIYETTKKLKPEAVTEICPCGQTPHHAWLPYMNQAVTADPVGAFQVRKRIKFYKALMGPKFAVYADHVELSDMTKDFVEQGRDFSSAIGTGGVVGTKFIWPKPRRKLKKGLNRLLTKDKIKSWKTGLALFNKMKLSQGEYLNLYDIAFDKPEAHVVKKDDVLHYAFYTPKADAEFKGELRFHGVKGGPFEVYDYVAGKVLGQIDEKKPSLEASFTGSLLVQLRAAK